MNNTRREEEEETILTQEILLRATMDYQEQTEVCYAE